jgi:hypothetical protein
MLLDQTLDTHSLAYQETMKVACAPAAADGLLDAGFPLRHRSKSQELITSAAEQPLVLKLLHG